MLSPNKQHKLEIKLIKILTMGGFTHLVIVVIKTEDVERDGSKVCYAQATRQVIELDVEVDISTELQATEETKRKYHFLGEDTLAIKKNAKYYEDKAKTWNEYQFSPEDLGSPLPLDGGLTRLKKFFGKEKGFRFRGTYDFRPKIRPDKRIENIRGSLYHVVLPEFLCLDKNTLWKYDSHPPIWRLRATRYTVTWYYPHSYEKPSQYPRFRPSVDFYFDENEWKKMILDGETTVSVAPWAKKLYREAKDWIPAIGNVIKR